MKVKSQGYEYETGGIIGGSGDTGRQRIRFARQEWRSVAEAMSIGETFKTVVQPPTAQFLVTTAGTTAEEVLSVVVEHLDHTEGVVACDNTRKAIHHLMAAIELLKSMENRIQVDHEGTPQ